MKKLVSSPLTMLLWLGTFAGLAGLLYSARAAFISGFCQIKDYGIYTNMMWNVVHGNGFTYLGDMSYLRVHLSFSLALFGVVFHFFDHPMSLVVLQWVFVTGGAAILYITAKKAELPRVAVAGVLFFFVAYRLTQSALMAQFHGVTAYFLLVPWLYYTLCYKPKAAWLPLFLILGIREEAFVFILPMMIYFSVRSKSRLLWTLTGITFVYGLFALFALYPAINGKTIFEYRSRFLGSDNVTDSLSGSFAGERQGFFSLRASRTILGHIDPRLVGIILTFTPVLFFSGMNTLPGFIFPLFGLMIAFFSPYNTQQSLGAHYSPPVITVLAIALLEIVRRAKIRNKRALSIRIFLLALFVVLIHLDTGFIWGGRKHEGVFAKAAPSGYARLHAASLIPKNGILMTSQLLSAYTANRKLLLVHEMASPTNMVDHVFLETLDLHSALEGRIYEEYQAGTLRVLFYDGQHVILTRNPDLEDVRLPKKDEVPFLVANTPSHGGKDMFDAHTGLYRFWEGDGSRGPINLSFGGHKRLSPGTYRAIFTYRAQTPERTVRDSWGEAAVCKFNQQHNISAKSIPTTPTPEGTWDSIEIPFSIDETTDIEFRWTGADAPLLLRHVVFQKQNKEM